MFANFIETNKIMKNNSHAKENPTESFLKKPKVLGERDPNQDQKFYQELFQSSLRNQSKL